MLLRRALLLVAMLFAAACATPADSADHSAVGSRVIVTTATPTTTTARPRMPGVAVATRKRVPDTVDCLGYVTVVSKAAGAKASVVEDESTDELCRYRLPYERSVTNVSVLFRAEPPGTPSYLRTEDLFGNTAYQVGFGDAASCGLSVALDPYLEPNEHGSHLTVLGTYDAHPCAVTRKILDAVFDRLVDADPETTPETR